MQHSNNFEAACMELGLLQTSHASPRLTRFAAANAGRGTRLSVPSDVPGHSFFLLDITLTRDGRLLLIEANGSNAALSTALEGTDDRRAFHAFHAYMAKPRIAEPLSVVLAHQPGFLHIAEFYGRARLVADRIADTCSAAVRGADEELGDEAIAVVCDAIPRLAGHIVEEDGVLKFRGRRIALLANPNLLPELARLGKIQRQGNWYALDTSFCHEGPCAPLVHDKGAQQDVCVGTGFTSLVWREAYNAAECFDCVKWFQANGMVAVGKMNAGSGGAGIEFFTTDASDDEIRHRLDALFTSVFQKHGANEASTTMFPIRFFEFGQSTSYDMYGKGHLWDLRVQCLVYPGHIEVTPCIIRLCPQPFDGTYARGSVVSNLTGRVDRATLGRYMRAPFAMRRSQPGSVMEALGISEAKLQEILHGCARWCESAWNHSTTITTPELAPPITRP
jgi:hypothetical protein